MEEVGAAPTLVHQPLAGGFHNMHPVAKKRGSSVQLSSFTCQNSLDNWSPMSWEWDSARFVAKPLQSDGTSVERSLHVIPDFPKKSKLQNARTSQKPGEDGENLRVKLGGGDGAGTSGSSGVMNLVDEPQAILKPNKRVRSGSPVDASYPICQVDNCKEDLSTAKDYHRRHKVCDIHSKASKALVRKQMQRFCQQCSRFHSLSEFDEGKRSCRRRLAGHNKRRRKTQEDDGTRRLPAPVRCDNNISSGLDIVNLLAVLARAQGNSEDRTNKVSPVPDKDQLIQILSKINSLPLSADIASKLPLVESAGASPPNLSSLENQNKEIINASSPSTMDFLSSLSTIPQAQFSDAFELPHQPRSEESGCEKSKSPRVDEDACVNLSREQIMEVSIRGERSSTSHHSPLEDVDYHAQKASPSLPLQLFSSSLEDDSPRKLQSERRNHHSSSSSNPLEGRSVLSLPPVIHDLFPVQTSKETNEHDYLSAGGCNITHMKSTKSIGCSTSLQLFGHSAPANENGSIQSSPHQAGYTSSGSDQSPSSFITDLQDRTGRIIFKLFDKDPGHLPGLLRAQIYNWLSSSPSEMESYIRPGCTVLSLYLSMSSFAWDQLEENLNNYVKILVRDIDVDFWGNGKFLIHTERQMASHKDGRIRLCRSLRTWSRPELISVSPVAVVGGQEISLLLTGKRLTVSGTKIRCTHAAGHNISLFPTVSYQNAAYDQICLGSFKIELTSSILGRIFIEVENNLRGTSFPVIIADAAICQELRLLEPDINGNPEVLDGVAVNQLQNKASLKSRDEALHFLNELGWLFQRKRNSSFFENTDYSLSRFQFILVFCVEHDFCVLVEILLGILLEFSLGRDSLARKSLEMLAESHLLNKAVKRRCRNMVNLLIHYHVVDSVDNSDRFIFVPNMAGPDGVTPLHLAACASFSDDIVDALTSDSHQVGLHSWNSVLDSNGLSPYAYAAMRNNNSYNDLVARKFANRKSNQVSVFIENEIHHFQAEVDMDKKNVSNINHRQEPCSRCVLVAGYSRKFPHSQGFIHRPFIHSMLVVAAVCVCVCLFLRSRPYISCVAPFAWDNLGYGTN